MSDKSLRQKIDWLIKEIKCLARNSGSGGDGIESIQEGDNISIDNTDPKNPIVSSTGGESSLTEEFQVTVGAGSFDVGDTFPSGLTLSQAFEMLLTDTFYPTFVAPSFSLSQNSGLREAGEDINLTLTGTFNRGQIRGAVVSGTWNPNAIQNPRAGLPSSYDIDGTTYTTSALSQNKIISNFIVPNGTSNFTASVNYTEGLQPKDSSGADYSTHLSSGSLNASTSVTGYLRRFAGSVASVPVNGADVRSSLLGTSVINTANNFTFNTGTTNKTFVIAIPSNKSLVSVTNTGTNENLLSGFVLSDITTVPDASGTNRPYKVYIMTNAIPFSINYLINVTIS